MQNQIDQSQALEANQLENYKSKKVQFKSEPEIKKKQPKKKKTQSNKESSAVPRNQEKAHNSNSEELKSILKKAPQTPKEDRVKFSELITQFVKKLPPDKKKHLEEKLQNLSEADKNAVINAVINRFKIKYGKEIEFDLNSRTKKKIVNQLIKLLMRNELLLKELSQEELGLEKQNKEPSSVDRNNEKQNNDNPKKLKPSNGSDSYAYDTKNAPNIRGIHVFSGKDYVNLKDRPLISKQIAPVHVKHKILDKGEDNIVQNMSKTRQELAKRQSKSASDKSSERER